MAVSFKHKLYENGITVSEINDKKFKSDCIVVRFITPASDEYSPAYSLLVDLLSVSSGSYPSREILAEACAELYGTVINSFAYKVSDSQIFGLSVNFIGDEYTIGGEKISVKASEMLLDCIFNPQIENGRFPENYFNLKKQELIDSINSIVNNKRQYAVVKAQELTFEGEPASCSPFTSAENTKKLTQDDVVKAYKRILSEAMIDITFCGGGNNAQAKKLVLDKFGELDRKLSAPQSFNKPSPLKKEVCRKEERMAVKQCKTVMSFKGDCENFYANKLMCAMLGGAPTSKLFLNVREKLSLCYYCASGIIEGKNTMIIDSGLDEDKLEVAEKEILKQLEAMQNGNFTQEELENTKLFLSGAYRSNYDTVTDMNSWYFFQAVRSTAYSPDEVGEIINKITAEDIIASAKSYKLDTVYTLKPLKGGAEQ